MKSKFEMSEDFLKNDDILKCPICGEELVRSKKGPEYILCRNCKKRFKPKKKTAEKAERPGEERPRAKRTDTQRTGRERPAEARDLSLPS